MRIKRKLRKLINLGAVLALLKETGMETNMLLAKLIALYTTKTKSKQTYKDMSTTDIIISVEVRPIYSSSGNGIIPSGWIIIKTIK
jgi:hypothetical protein